MRYTSAARPPTPPPKPRPRHASHTDKDETAGHVPQEQEQAIAISRRARVRVKGKSPATRNSVNNSPAIHNANSNRAMDGSLPNRVNRNNRRLGNNIFPRPHAINPCRSPPCSHQNPLRAEAADRPCKTDFRSRAAQNKIPFTRLCHRRYHRLRE